MMGLNYVSFPTFYLAVLWIPGVLQKCLTLNDSCAFYKSNAKLQCSGAIHEFHEEDVRILELCQLHLTTLHIDEIAADFPNVEEIIIRHSKIAKIVGSFPVKNFIKVLNFTYLSIEDLEGDFLNPLHYLEVLDLRHNRLRSLDLDLIETFPRLKHVYISDNKWNCSLDLTWVTHLSNSTVRDLDYLNCHGRLYTDKPLMVIVAYRETMNTQCPKDCLCELVNVVRHPTSEQMTPIIQMNCSNLGLTELPDKLPKHTRILYLRQNNIQDLMPLINNDQYKLIWDLYLDDNDINSIAMLEGSFWLTHFRLLSLKNNKLTQLPSYAIDNALQENIHTPALQMFFGKNPWRCDCLFTPGFQELIVKYHKQFRDISEIRCSYVEGDENSMIPVMQISRNDVCRSPEEPSIRALDLLNCVLASLIILILSKLAYDYYNFKKTGRLPWIVTKMP